MDSWHLIVKQRGLQHKRYTINFLISRTRFPFSVIVPRIEQQQKRQKGLYTLHNIYYHHFCSEGSGAGNLSTEFMAPSIPQSNYYCTGFPLFYASFFTIPTHFFGPYLARPLYSIFLISKKILTQSQNAFSCCRSNIEKIAIESFLLGFSTCSLLLHTRLG